jgi:serine/tyrosine/threonine adenylyltransferase
MLRLSRLPVEHRLAGLGPDLAPPVTPAPLAAPRVVHLNTTLAAQLGVSEDHNHLLSWVAGAQVPDDARPVASIYAGHQFGTFVPQLGDGRALLLGEVITPDGASWDVQLKGSGQTPFSRFGDGRAVLRSSIREYIGSEAMHALGVPTTRALALVTSDTPVLRETREQGAALVRVAPSHLRFGHFELFASRGQTERLRQLLQFAIAEDFPALHDAPAEQQPIALLRDVARRTAVLMADWMAVGFVHTVMNTDNMSLLGLTLDYGPYAFMDGFDPGWTPNHTDVWGRYAYAAQPGIALWNLDRLADALALLAPRDELADAVHTFAPAYERAMDDRFHAKLGLTTRSEESRACIEALLTLMSADRSDWTRTFRALADTRLENAAPPAALAAEFSDQAALADWCAQYQEVLRRESSVDDQRARQMNRVNPCYVPRTHLLQHAIARAEAGDMHGVAELFDVVTHPFTPRDGFEAYAAAPTGDTHVSLSCSS